MSLRTPPLEHLSETDLCILSTPPSEHPQHFVLPPYTSYHMSSLPRSTYHPIHPQLSQQPIAIAPHHQLAHHPPQISRKRPKYSRSKLGCLSCRVRKVKVSFTSSVFRSVHSPPALIGISVMNRGPSALDARTLNGSVLGRKRFPSLKDRIPLAMRWILLRRDHQHRHL